MLSVRTFEGDRIVLEPGETADVTRITPGMEDLKSKGKLSYVEIGNNQYDDESGHEYDETYPAPHPTDGSGGILESGPLKYDRFVLTVQHIETKQVQLSAKVTRSRSVIFLPEGGIPQFPNIDFKTDCNRLYWDGLGLDGFLEVGEAVHIYYN